MQFQVVRVCIYIFEYQTPTESIWTLRLHSDE